MTTPAVYALGNFDGVHRGHQAVIAATVACARALRLPPRVLTFDPHPRRYFKPDCAPFCLTTTTQKEHLLKKYGIDAVVTLPFTPELAATSAQDFASKMLATDFQAKHLIAGQDFTFGHDRAGTMDKLGEWLRPLGLGVTAVAPLGDANANISSTRIRDYLRNGDIDAAMAMLGHPWVISGTVEHGAQRGRSIGIPTANVSLGDYVRPRFGVYAVRAARHADTHIFNGIANIGTRPTVDGTTEKLEVHLFDFDQDIYGEEWDITPTRFIRPEMKFDSLIALKQQIAQDIFIARGL